MKIVTMNVRGIQSAWDAGLKSYVLELAPDVFLMQEIRTDQRLERCFIPGYEEIFFPSVKKGHAGVGAFVRTDGELKVIPGLGVLEKDGEGRALTLDMGRFYLVDVYAPAEDGTDEREAERKEWFRDLVVFAERLQRTKPVLIAGDMNVTARKGSTGMRGRPRKDAAIAADALQMVLDGGYADVWQLLNGNRLQLERAGTKGERLDYFLVPEAMIGRLRRCRMLEKTAMSDHRAIMLELK